MLSYLSGVAIWFIILYATSFICIPLIRRNGWYSYINRHRVEPYHGGDKLAILATSAIPIFRFLICVLLFVMAIVDFDTFEEWKDGL